MYHKMQKQSWMSWTGQPTRQPTDRQMISQTKRRKESRSTLVKTEIIKVVQGYCSNAISVIARACF